MNKEPNWTLEDVDSEDEMETDDNTSLKFSSLTSSSPRSSPRSSTTSPRTATASPRTTTSSPFPQYDELNIDITDIKATPTNETDIERIIDKSKALNDIIERILNQKTHIHPSEYESLLTKLIKRGFIIREDILDKMKYCEIKNNYNCYLIQRLLEEYQSIHPSRGGKKYSRKTIKQKKSSKKTKKFLGKFRKSKKSRKSKKFPKTLIKKR